MYKLKEGVAYSFSEKEGIGVACSQREMLLNQLAAG